MNDILKILTAVVFCYYQLFIIRVAFRGGYARCLEDTRGTMPTPYFLQAVAENNKRPAVSRSYYRLASIAGAVMFLCLVRMLWSKF